MLAIKRETAYIGEEEEEADDDDEILEADAESSVDDQYQAGFDRDIPDEEPSDDFML